MSAETKVPDIAAADETKGYIYLVPESYGFDNDVWVYVQPRGQILDFNFKSQTNDPLLMTKVFKAYFGRQFVIPAEYDIYIDYSPLSYKNSDSTSKAEEGKFSFLAQWIANTDSYKNDDTVEIVDRLESLATESDRVVVQPVNEESDGDSYEILDDTVLAPVNKRESIIEGKAVDDKWAKWRGEEAFNVGGYSITNEEAAVGSTVVLIVIIGIVVICCFVSYLERKKIAEEARRASAYAKRASQKIRRSIKSMRGQDPGPEEPVEARTDKEIKKDAAANATNKNEKAFLNDMFTEQEKKD